MQIVSCYGTDVKYNYVFDNIVLDDYLRKLFVNLCLDNNINKHSKITSLELPNIDSIKKEISFYDSINLKLRDVYESNTYFDKVYNIDNYTKLINPKNLIVIFNNKNYLSYLKYEYLNYHNNVIASNNYISLGIGNDIHTKMAYIHEIMHTQVTRMDLKDDLNNEVIPIFMELLYLDSINYDQYIYYRFACLKNKIDRLMRNKGDLFNVKMYIKSTLQALNLLNLYLNSNLDGKKEIIYNIQQVIDKNIYLEDFLSKYDINYDSSKKSYKELKHIKNA